MGSIGQVKIPARKAPKCRIAKNMPHTKICTGTGPGTDTTVITDIKRKNAAQLRRITLTFNLKNKIGNLKKAFFATTALKSIRFDYTLISQKSKMSVVVTGNPAVSGFMMSMYSYLISAMKKNSPYSFPKCLVQLHSPFLLAVRTYIHRISGVNNIPPILYVHVNKKGVQINNKP